MIRSLKFILLASAALMLAACGQDDAEQQVERPPVAAPGPGDDQMAWRNYITDVVRRHGPDDYTQTFNYFLPAEDVEEYEAIYARQLENVEVALSRTIPPGNMLIFTSPHPHRMADLMVSAFEVTPENSLPGVYVLMVGRTDDEERVREVVTATGASFIFVDMQ
ncbi:MAG: hypothetical protein ACXIUZ_02785 [Lysobacteraceae bacterium]